MIAIIMKRFIREHFPKHYFHRFVVFLMCCTWGRRVYDANKHHAGSVIYVRPNKGATDIIAADARIYTWYDT